MSDIVKAQFSLAIQNGDTELSAMLQRIDGYHIQGKLTDEERDALYEEARQYAIDTYKDNIDVPTKLAELNERITALEAAVADIISGDDDEPDDPDKPDLPDEYVDGHWYYNGDRVLFEGKVYVCCNVPDGMVCVWSPAVYPAYWRLEE